jgi:hypothetical protein
VRNVSPGFGAIVEGDGSWAVLGDDSLKLLSHLIHPLLARDGFELTVAAPPQGSSNAVWVVMLVRQLFALDAYEPPRHGMIAVASDLDHPSVFDIDFDSAHGMAKSAVRLFRSAPSRRG